MATTKTPEKKPTTKIDAAVCRGGQGRYLSAKSSKPCSNPRHPGRQLCDSCEDVYRKARRAAKPAAPKAIAASKPKVVAIDQATRKTGTVPKPKREPVGRVAAMVAPEVTIAKTE